MTAVWNPGDDCRLMGVHFDRGLTMPKASSNDLREGIMEACDQGERAVAKRCGVSESLIEKLKQRRRAHGTVAAAPCWGSSAVPGGAERADPCPVAGQAGHRPPRTARGAGAVGVAVDLVVSPPAFEPDVQKTP